MKFRVGSLVEVQETEHVVRDNWGYRTKVISVNLGWFVVIRLKNGDRYTLPKTCVKLVRKTIYDL